MHHISTSTCLCEKYYTPEGTGYDMERAIRLCAEAGFQYQDIDFSHTTPNLPLAQDTWQQWGDGLVELLQENHIQVEQTHTHWYRHDAMHSDEEEEWNLNIIRRSMELSGRFGKDIVIVAHTNSMSDSEGYNPQKSMEMNLAYFREIGEIAAKQGNRIAIEILFPNSTTSFGTTAGELMELLTRLNDPLFGICWDFGHANIAGLDQEKSLELIGSHLIATHCQDNYGVLPDIHLLPFYGRIDWRSMMQILRKIGYCGNLDLEVHMFTRTLPMDMQLECCKTSFRVISRLMNYLSGKDD